MIEYAASKSTYLTIGLGSCNRSGTIDHPFTAEEREDMIKRSVNIEIPYEIKRIPDFDDNELWVKWIIENLRFDVFMTNSGNEKEVFTKAGIQVEDIPFFDRETYSASEVRKRILGDGDWSSLLPAGTIKHFWYCCQYRRRGTDRCQCLHRKHVPGGDYGHQRLLFNRQSPRWKISCACLLHWL